MEARRSDSSGTDDDLPPALTVGRVNNSRVVLGNGKAGVTPNTVASSKPIDQLIRSLEQDAYTAVLRAFGAQSEHITWAKERLISDLRKELRVTDEQHREFLARVSGDDSLRKIRDFRQSGGDNQATGVSNQAASASPLVPQPRKKQKTGVLSQQVTMPSPHPAQALAPPPTPASALTSKPSSKKLTTIVPRSKTKGSSDKISGQGRAPSQSKKKGASGEDRWVGRYIKMRWPDDSNIYDAFVREFHKEDGTHAVVFDMGTEKETCDRVDLSKIALVDAQANGKHNMGKKSSSTDKHQGSKKRIEKHANPLQKSKGDRKHKLPSVDTLVKQVQELEHDADPSKIERAKRLAKEHEESLRKALEEVGESTDEDDESDDRRIADSSRHSQDDNKQDRDRNTDLFL